MINSLTPNGRLKKSEKTDGYMNVIRICPDNELTRVMNRDLGARALESDFPTYQPILAVTDLYIDTRFLPEE